MNIIYSHMNNTYTPDYPYLYGLFITPIALNISYKLINSILKSQICNLYKKRTKPSCAQSSDYSHYNSINPYSKLYAIYSSYLFFSFISFYLFIFFYLFRFFLFNLYWFFRINSSTGRLYKGIVKICCHL